MIRPIAPGDAAWVAALIRAAFATVAAQVDPPPSALRVTADAVRAHLASGGGAVYGTEGCILWSEKADGLYVGRLAVRPESRGQGIATALLAHAEAVAREMGLRRIQLEVRLALESNRRLFARAGFVEGARRAHPGYERPTYVEAEKLL
jgi:ribosomal protein S18 acetylase RimI-like enzyme